MECGSNERGRSRVLVIDDDHTIVHLILTTLAQSGLPLELRGTSSGYEGCIQCGRFRPDLVLLDVHLPDLDGAEVLRSMKGGPGPAPKVLVITGDQARVPSMTALGCDGHLAKPFSPEELEQAVRRLLNPAADDNPDGLDVLLVEDNPGDARLVEALLAEHPITSFRITTCPRLSEALEALRSKRYDVLLLDLSLPDAHGLETVLRMRPACDHLPIVVMTGLDDEQLALQAVKEGAQDYLVKGQFDPRGLARTLVYAVERNRTLLELEQARQREHFMATHDPLTGLANRSLFFDHLGQALSYAERYGQTVAVLFCDLDRFKSINDRLGHGTGDRLLRTVGQRLLSCIRRSDTAARLGGDEFALLLQNLSHAEDAAKVAEHVLAELARPCLVDDHELSIATSIGIALYPQDARDAATLVRNADIALLSAKDAGRRDFKFYTAERNLASPRRHDLEQGLRRALDRGQFIIHYQPQVDLRDDTIFGAEALVRWEHPDFGLLPPGEFIPQAEESGLIGPIAEWVLREACEQQRQWLERGLPPIRMAVNLSVDQLRQRRLPQVVAQVLQSNGLEPDRLELEITESGILRDSQESLKTLHALKLLGVRISIDDFGTGQASLSYLRRFPADTVKLDRSYVRHLVSDHSDAAIATAILAMAHGLRLDTIAEGVETVEQVEFLSRYSCYRVQGFLFSRPVPAEEFAVLLSAGRLGLPRGVPASSALVAAGHVRRPLPYDSAES